MRVRLVLASLAALAAISGINSVEAQRVYEQEHHCTAVGRDHVRYISGPIILPSNTSSALRQQMQDEFTAHVMSASGLARDVVCNESSDPRIGVYGTTQMIEYFEREWRRVGARTVRTGWTRNYMPAAGTRPSPPGVGPNPGVYIMPPTMPGMAPPADTYRESEESRQVVAARYRQQQDQVRSITESNARQAAEHRARLAESERQNAAHRAAMAENARQQEAHRRARAEWEARVAACRAGNRDACGHRVTPQ